jgi:hypothetical protein
MMIRLRDRHKNTENRTVLLWEDSPVFLTTRNSRPQDTAFL